MIVFHIFHCPKWKHSGSTIGSSTRWHWWNKAAWWHPLVGGWTQKIASWTAESCCYCWPYQLIIGDGHWYLMCVWVYNDSIVAGDIQVRLCSMTIGRPLWNWAAEAHSLSMCVAFAKRCKHRSSEKLYKTGFNSECYCLNLVLLFHLKSCFNSVGSELGVFE